MWTHRPPTFRRKQARQSLNTSMCVPRTSRSSSPSPVRYPSLISLVSRVAFRTRIPIHLPRPSASEIVFLLYLLGNAASTRATTHLAGSPFDDNESVLAHLSGLLRDGQGRTRVGRFEGGVVVVRHRGCGRLRRAKDTSTTCGWTSTLRAKPID